MATRKRKDDATGEEVGSPVMQVQEVVPQYIPVEGESSLVRDPATGAILNINKKAYFRAVQHKLKQKTEVSEMEALKSEVADLKNMLAQLLDKVNGNGTN